MGTSIIGKTLLSPPYHSVLCIIKDSSDRSLAHHWSSRDIYVLGIVFIRFQVGILKLDSRFVLALAEQKAAHAIGSVATVHQMG